MSTIREDKLSELKEIRDTTLKFKVLSSGEIGRALTLIIELLEDEEDDRID